MTNIDKAQSVARNKRIKDHLARAVRYEGIIMTYEEMSKELLAKGYAPELVVQEPSLGVREQREKKYKDYLRRHCVMPGLTNPSAPEAVHAAELKADVIKGKEAYQAVSPNGTLVDISKIQHDYMVKLIW